MPIYRAAILSSLVVLRHRDYIQDEIMLMGTISPPEALTLMTLVPWFV